MLSRMPAVQVRSDIVAYGLGLDITTAEIAAKPGTLRLAYNYECSIDGGLQRIGGIDVHDGRPSPHQATYILVSLAAAPTGLALGNTITGATSAATGRVIYIDGLTVGVTMVAGQFALEVIKVGAATVGTIADLYAPVTGELDNQLAAAAATEYRAAIGRMPGTGKVRGLAILGSTLYGWRDNLGGTALVLYKATSAGWTIVPLKYEVSFTAGSAEYAEGSTITKGGVSAVVRRVVLESGAWTGTAAGRLIIDAPTGGNFTAGAAAGGGACTLAGAQTQITLAPGGRVRTHAEAMTASVTGRRLYGCDGVNREFELGDDILVPLNTGMTTLRATAVIVHKRHVFFGFNGSLQHSSIGAPYQFSAVTGAAELGTGDNIADFVAVGGSSNESALMVLCANSLFALYGNSAADWNLSKLSNVSGCVTGTAQDAGGVIALDSPGVVRYPATQNFGNFAWSVVSRQIGAIAAGQSALASVFVPSLSRYRIFLGDGTGLSGLVGKGGALEWTLFAYGRTVVCAVCAELGGVERTFVGDDQGWVYETDVGRSFAGDEIQHMVRLNALSQRSTTTLKKYRGGELQAETRSACALRVSSEFFTGEDDIAPSDEQVLNQPGVGLQWDFAGWDSAYWDTPSTSRRRIELEGEGSSVAITVAGASAQELPHTLRAVLLSYTPLRPIRY